MRSPTPNDPNIRPLEFGRERTMGTTAEEIFRRLTIGDAGLLAGLDDDMPRRGVGRLDPRT